MSVQAAFAERVLPEHTGYAQHRARYLWVAGRLAGGARVLDAGCGIGYGAAILAGAGTTVTGIDASAEAVATARRECPAGRFVVGDVLRLPFRDGGFDAAVCLEVIEHVPDPALLVAELARVLRPGGVLFLSTPNARMERLHARSIGYGENPYHISLLGPAQLRRLLRGAGLEPVLRGQAGDQGLVHLVLQALDPLGLRLRLAPRRRVAVAAAVSAASGRSGATERRFRFSRLVARSAAIVLAEARKPAAGGRP